MKKWVPILIFVSLTLSACTTGKTAENVLPSATITPRAAQKLTPTATKKEPTETATNTSTPTEAPTATIVPQDYGPDKFPTNVNPLTGLQVADDENLERRPVAIKIQTFPRGQRPAWAISLADIVYDYYQNNGLTRLHAIFYTYNSEQVGPIRSARLLDGALIRAYKSIFAFGGADIRVLNRLLNAEYYNRLIFEGSNTCPAMCRIDPNGYNYLVADTIELGKYAESRDVENVRQDLDGMRFEHELLEGGELGEQVSVRYSISSYTRWEYDPESSRYLRYQDTQEDTGQGEAYEPFLDRETGEQVGAENVVIIKAVHEYTYKSGANEVVDILLGGQGTAYAFRDGQVYEVQWSRPTPESLVTLTYLNVENYPFKPGTTWFQVIGQSSVDIETDNDEGIYRFEFRIP